MPCYNSLCPARNAIREYLGQDGIPRATILGGNCSVRHRRECPPAQPAGDSRLAGRAASSAQPGEQRHQHGRRQQPEENGLGVCPNLSLSDSVAALGMRWSGNRWLPQLVGRLPVDTEQIAVSFRLLSLGKNRSASSITAPRRHAAHESTSATAAAFPNRALSPTPVRRRRGRRQVGLGRDAGPQTGRDNRLYTGRAQGTS